jgi:nucleoside-diphosphate-sugar epimerase
MMVLVTGGTGFIGSHLVDRLLGEGHQVRCIVRRTSKRDWLAGKPVELVECHQIADPTLLREAVCGVDVVFHVLGTLVAPSLEAFRQVNVEPVRMLLDACQGRPLQRFVLVGSLGAAGPTPSPTGCLSETDPCHPVSAYGRSKLEAEELTRRYQGKVPYTIVRLSAVYGPRDTSLLTLFRSASQRGFLPQIGPQPKTLSLGHVRDIVEGLYQAGTTATSLNETYFLSGEEIYSFDEIRATLQHVMGKPVRLRTIPGFVVWGMKLHADVLARVFGKHLLLNRDRLTTLSYPRWVCDVAKARCHFGYRQTVPLEGGFRETYEWYRDNGWL